MRLAILATLALLPTAAFAQAGTQSLQARVSQPAAFVRASASTPAPAAAATASATAAPHYHDVIVKSELSSPAMDQTLAEGGSLSYTLGTDGLHPSGVVAPVLIHTVGRILPVDQAVKSDADVTLALTVDSQGVPCEIVVLHSAGTAVDKGTLDAVRAFRFKPATYQNLPIVSHLIFEVKIQK